MGHDVDVTVAEDYLKVALFPVRGPCRPRRSARHAMRVALALQRHDLDVEEAVDEFCGHHREVRDGGGARNSTHTRRHARTDTRAPAPVCVQIYSESESDQSSGGGNSCSDDDNSVYDPEDEHAAEGSADEAHGVEPTEDDAKATGYDDRVKRARAARAVVTARLSDEQHGEVTRRARRC